LWWRLLEVGWLGFERMGGRDVELGMKGKRVWRRKPLFFGCERSAEGFVFFFKNLAQNGVVLRPGQLKKN